MYFCLGSWEAWPQRRRKQPTEASPGSGDCAENTLCDWLGRKQGEKIRALEFRATCRVRLLGEKYHLETMCGMDFLQFL